MHDRRYEKIFECDLSEEKFKELSLADVQHDETQITTIYFGARSKKWEEIQSLSALKSGIRVRYYGQKPKGEVFIVDESSCILEFKTHKDKTRANTKIRIGREEKVNFGEILEYLTCLQKDQAKKDKFKKFSKITEILERLIEDFEITEIMPIGAANFKRLHFVFDDYRATIDFDIKYYAACEKDLDVIMLQRGSGKKTIVELKSNEDTDEVKRKEQEFLEELKCEAKQVTRTKAKSLKEILSENQVEFIEPELIEKSKYDWEITEREIKLDAEKNPKEFINSCLKELRKDGIVAGEPETNVNYQYAYNVGESGIIYMAKNLEGKNAVIKYKTYISHDEKNGTLVRYEYVEPFSEENFKKAMKFVGGNVDKDIKKSPFFCRDRLRCNMIMPKTKNVFELYADHSYFVNGDGADFYQVEIEYAGIVANEEDLKTENAKLVQTIDDDFAVLTDLVPKYFVKAGCGLRYSTRTKYDWVKKECF